MSDEENHGCFDVILKGLLLLVLASALAIWLLTKTPSEYIIFR